MIRIERHRCATARTEQVLGLRLRIRIRQAQLVADHALLHPEAERHQLLHRAHQGGHVLGLGRAQLQLGVPLLRAPVEVDVRPDQIPVERLFQGLGIVVADVVAHLGLQFLVAQLAGRARAGRGLAEDALAHLGVQVVGQPLEEIRGPALVAGLDQLHLHRFREHRGRVRAQVGHRGLEDGNLVLARARPVAAQAQRHAEHLGERQPVLDRVPLAHEGPGGQPGDAAAHGNAALAAVHVGDELVGRQGQAVEQVGLVAQAQLAPADQIPLEETRVAPLVPLRHPAGATPPHDLAAGEPLAERIEQILEQPAYAAPVDQFAGRVGQLQVTRFVAGALHRDRQPADRQLALAQLGRVVEIAFLHLLGERQVGVVVALAGGAQQRGQAERRQPAGIGVVPDGAHTGQRRRRVLAGQVPGFDRTAQIVVQHHHIPLPRLNPAVTRTGRSCRSSLPRPTGW